MALRVAIILIVGIIIRKCILEEGSADNLAASRIDIWRSGNSSSLKTFNNFRRRQKSNNDVRVINGKPARIEDYPFMVAICYLKQIVPLGEGAIIGTVWILAAAHYFYGREYRNITDSDVEKGLVNTVSNSTDYWNSPERAIRTVIAIYNHPRFNKTTHDYDISVLKVDKEFSGVYENYAPFASPSYNYKRFESARILSWRNDRWFDNLTQTKVYIIPKKSCQRIYHGRYQGNIKVGSRQVCTIQWGEHNGCIDGPLVKHGRIIGMLSNSTCLEGYPIVNVFTKISKFNSFILKTMSGTS